VPLVSVLVVAEPGRLQVQAALQPPGAASCRTTLAPPPLPAGLLARRAGRPCAVGVGEHDRFLPPRRLAPALRRTMNLDLRILPGMGHLATPGHLGDVVSLVAEAADQPAG
jgi:hypothetical protein